MDLTRLEMFNAVASTGSITRRRRKLHRVPSNPSPPASASWRPTSALSCLSARTSALRRCRLQDTAFCAIASRSSPWWTRREWWWRATNPQRLFSLGSLESTTRRYGSPALWPTLIGATRKFIWRSQPAPSGTMIDGVLEGALSAAFVDGRGASGLEGLPVFPEEMIVAPTATHHHRASESGRGQRLPFRANCSYRRHFEAGFMPWSDPGQDQMSLTTGCWPASSPAPAWR